jgi:flap endonuclease-1
VELKSLHGRKIAIDASMAIYQFLIAVRSQNNPNAQSFQLTNDAGETTSHIQGMFNRTIRYMTEGIKPIYIFDGKPPQMKSHELVKRRERRNRAEEALKQAVLDENVTELDKQSKRLVRAGQKENIDCQTLLQYMGVPVLIAPCEAEAQAASLAQEGYVYGVGTEDMDALTFRTPMLIRKMTFAGSGGGGASKNAAMVQTINYEKAISGLNITHEQFVDLCILLGCDYCDTIRGVGPKTALKLIREYKSIERIVQNIDTKKYTVPDSWLPKSSLNTKKPAAKVADAAADDDDAASSHDEESPPEVRPVNTSTEDDDDDDADDVDDGQEEEFVPAYVQARELFLNHEVITKQSTDPKLSDVLKWKPCQVEELSAFLIDTMGFNRERVMSSITKLQSAYTKNLQPQSRLDSFFKPTVSSMNKKRTLAPPYDSKNNAKKSKGTTAKAMMGKRR